LTGRDERHYQFGRFRVSSVERLLRRDEAVVPLPPKAVDTLVALLSSPGRMLEKGELMKMVWPDSFVEEGALVRNISQLRKALGEGAEDSEYIETIPKRGYRFVAPLREVADAAALPESPAAPPVPTRKSRVLWLSGAAVLVLVAAIVIVALKFTRGAAGIPVHSLAVLPFENLSKDPAQVYFSEGMTEVLITNLARITTLRVISLASVDGHASQKPPAAQAREWNADAVLQGSVIQAQNRVRIHVELVDARSGLVYWSDTYERNAGDALELQSEVASAIVREIRVKLTPQEQQFLAKSSKVAPAALNAYLRGRYAWNRRTEQSLRSAVDYFTEAIRIEPGYALAYAGLADTYSVLGSNGVDGMAPREAMPLAKINATKALETDPLLAEAHSSLAYVLMSYDWNLPEAEKEFQRAIELNPGYSTAHHWYGHFFLAAGRPDLAMEEMKRALDLEPLSPSINVGIGWCLYYLRQYEQSIDQYRNTLKTEPAFAMGHLTLGMALQQQKKYEDAAAEFKTAVELSGSTPGAVAALACAYGQSGKMAAAREQLAKLKEMEKRRYVPAVFFANVYRGLGDQEHLMASLAQAVEDRSDYLLYVRSDPALEKLAQDPRFRTLAEKLPPLKRP
jgi:TolB-like protein/DNA-binding winged helix-turn-helix (wHTH) protein/Tfp pilus assembly protein PilF